MDERRERTGVQEPGRSGGEETAKKEREREREREKCEAFSRTERSQQDL